MRYNVKERLIFILRPVTLIFMSDSPDMLRYDKMVEHALRGVVKRAIENVIEEGELPGDHHFYITFLTEYPGVKIPEYLKERYPGEMTIVLQYQFFDLYVDDEKMQVKLSFNNIPELLTIPLSAISIFADPSVNFALQFQPVTDDLHDSLLDALDEIDGGEDDNTPDDSDKKSKKKSTGKKKKDGNSGDSGQVISLDSFRKKD